MKMEEAIAKRVEEAIAKFEEWFREEGYCEAVDGAPWDGREGGFLGTKDAEDLLPDFFEAKENAKYVFYEEQLRQHCWELGELFKSEQWNFEDKENIDDEEDVRKAKRREHDAKTLIGILRIARVRERFE
jgi:hypothetical protein